MNNTQLFGDKLFFAIELGAPTTQGKSKLGFWIENKRLGNFTKSGELKYSIKAFQQFINNKDFYYLTLLDNKTPVEIFEYFLCFDLLNSRKKSDVEEVERRLKFYLFFGDQFANQTGGFILLYTSGMVIFIIKRPMNGPVDRYDVPFQFFCDTFNNYIEYLSKAYVN